MKDKNEAATFKQAREKRWAEWERKQREEFEARLLKAKALYDQPLKVAL